jgi:hypothetical protein
MPLMARPHPRLEGAMEYVLRPFSRIAQPGALRLRTKPFAARLRWYLTAESTGCKPM